MTDKLSVDILIFGGGVAGLWTAVRLSNAGYACALIESQTLGEGQTIASQGVLHGGIKYALTGEASRASRAVAEMPAVWFEHLCGRHSPDLTDVTVLTQNQYLWPTPGRISRVATFFASRVLRSHAEKNSASEVPMFVGAKSDLPVYRVDERIICPQKLLESLARQVRGPILKVDAKEGVRFLDATSVEVKSQEVEGRTLRIDAKHIVLTAGAGNEAMLSQLASGGFIAGVSAPLMQRRPLHMVMVRGPRLAKIFGHCIGPSNVPRVTITSHQSDMRFGRIEPLWYLGGAIAEQGVDRSPDEQIAAAKKTLRKCVPWLDWNDPDLQWQTHRVDRAEGLTEGGRRPDVPVVQTIDDVTVCWPTKMVFGPHVAQQIDQIVASLEIEPTGPIDGSTVDWPTAKVAALPWGRHW